jgi:hypothetical protein
MYFDNNIAKRRFVDILHILGCTVSLYRKVCHLLSQCFHQISFHHLMVLHYPSLWLLLSIVFNLDPPAQTGYPGGMPPHAAAPTGAPFGYPPHFPPQFQPPQPHLHPHGHPGHGPHGMPIPQPQPPPHAGFHDPYAMHNAPMPVGDPAMGNAYPPFNTPTALPVDPSAGAIPDPAAVAAPTPVDIYALPADPTPVPAPVADPVISGSPIAIAPVKRRVIAAAAAVISPFITSHICSVDLLKSSVCME